MTRAEAARLGGYALAAKGGLAQAGARGNKIVREKAAARRAAVLAAIAQGQCLKQAAFTAGVSYRSASRYRAGRA